MSKKLTIIITVLVVVIVGLVVYIFLSNRGREDFRQPLFENMSSNFSLTDEVKSSTVEFFDSSPSLEDAQSYCEENRINCFYYCTEVNQEHEICDNIRMPNNGGPPEGFGNRE